MSTIPRPSHSLGQDYTRPATVFDPVLTYYADGTDLMMVWDGGRKGRRVTACGMTQDTAGGIYPFQTVRYADGSTHNVAPHVLHRA